MMVQPIEQSDKRSRKDSMAIIRKAVPSEAQLLSDLALKSKSVWGYDDEYLNNCREALNLEPTYIKDWPVFVAEVDQEIIGFVALRNIDGEDRLDHLWILPEHIRVGLGAKLFASAIESAKALGWNSFRLASEPRAEEFYVKMGMKNIGSIQSRIKPDLYLPHMEYQIS